MINKVRFVVAHDTGNPGSTAIQNAKNYINHANSGRNASAHLFVDDKQIIECIPALTAPPEKAWHVLYGVPKDNELYGANANDAAIAVEYCHGNNIDADKAYAKYVWALTKICASFDLNPARDVVGHFFLDPARRSDPVTGLAHSRRTYEQLLKDIVLLYEQEVGSPWNNPALADQGTVTTLVRLNLRRGPSTSSDVIEVLAANKRIHYKAVVTNGETVNNNPVWLQHENGYYFWSGGVAAV